MTRPFLVGLSVSQHFEVFFFENYEQRIFASKNRACRTSPWKNCVVCRTSWIGPKVKGARVLKVIKRIFRQLQSKVCVLAGSALCLGGKCPEHPRSGELWERERMSCSVTSQECGEIYGTIGEPFVLEWKTFPGHTTMPLLQKVNTMNDEIKIQPDISRIASSCRCTTTSIGPKRATETLVSKIHPVYPNMPVIFLQGALVDESKLQTITGKGVSLRGFCFYTSVEIPAPSTIRRDWDGEPFVFEWENFPGHTTHTASRKKPKH